VAFPSGNTLLSGIVHEPDSRRTDVGVLFVLAGVRGRHGVGFQYPRIARWLGARGIPSFRFDPHGMGDSEGVIEDTPTVDFFADVQTGRYVPDTLAALDVLRRETGCGRVVLWGLCAGSITALAAAARVPDLVHGLVLLSPPVLIERAPVDEAGNQIRTLYLRKIVSPRAWLRLIRLESDVGDITQMLGLALRRLPSRIAGRLRFGKSARTPRIGPVEPSMRGKPNPLFFSSVGALAAHGRSMLFLLGETDTLRQEFHDEFQEPVMSRRADLRSACTVHLVPGCNHLFTMPEWQDEAMRVGMAWLTARGLATSKA
jgi:pimeloyl-ACP methyl ester carboxylesterase